MKINTISVFGKSKSNSAATPVTQAPAPSVIDQNANRAASMQNMAALQAASANPTQGAQGLGSASVMSGEEQKKLTTSGAMTG